MYSTSLYTKAFSLLMAEDNLVTAVMHSLDWHMRSSRDSSNSDGMGRKIVVGPEVIISVINILALLSLQPHTISSVGTVAGHHS